MRFDSNPLSRFVLCLRPSATPKYCVPAPPASIFTPRPLSHPRRRAPLTTAHIRRHKDVSASMPPKQGTLNKFFAGNGGNTAKPQQSKLSFSSKSNPDSEEAREEQKENTNGHLKTEAKAEEDADADADVKMEEVETKVVAPKEEAATDEEDATDSRKRQSESDDDDEPPTKRQRVKPAVKQRKPAIKKENGTKSTKKNGRPSVKFEDDDDVEVKVEGEKPESVAAAAAAASADEPDKEGSSSEHEAEEESEDEKPEVAAKAREKVQSTLTSKTKDPYPDWKAGEAVPYAALCTTFSKIELTTKRLEIMAHCSLFLRQVLRLTPNDILPTVLLMVNKLAADYAGIELGIGESLIMKAIGETTGRNLAQIKEDQQKIGDLGLVAAKSRSNQPTMFRPKPLTVRGIHEGLIAIATVEGNGAQGRKVAGIKKLLSAADAHLAGKKGGIDITKDKGGPSEAKYIIRALEGKMRLGLAEKTVLVSVAQAMVTHEKSVAGKASSTDDLAKGEQIMKSVYNELPSYEVIVPAMIEHGIFNLRDSCKLQPGVPLKPMLARPTKSITEVLDRFEGKEFTCEYKYDGERAQIHFVSHSSSESYATAAPQAGKSEKGISNIFSRNSEDLSKKYPDILAKLPAWVADTTSSFVLDCETVAWDTEAKKVLPFQQLMTRKRKDVKVEDVKVKVCVFAFDILFLNGQPCVNLSFRERREKLYSAFHEVEGEFAFAKHGGVSNDIDAIQVLLEDSVKASCEGLMVKMLDGVESHYEPSRRSQNWLKVKKDYLAGVGDSLDLVVLGAYHGRGKRTSWYGAFLLACYNPNSQTYETVCNIGTGFSEAILEELHTTLEPLAIDRPKPFYNHSAGNKDQPDVWFEPRFVWEVLCADLTLSPRYKAAADTAGGGGKGVSLRFPRFLKVRDDKKPEDATTSSQVADMYRAQEGVASGKKAGPSVDDDFGTLIHIFGASHMSSYFADRS
ncbi:hypothetical protein FH972_022161 [Carpinus fangiana]|uniref:DNA ligase n=1 Tax=Carpinus fangiana TaxID=176857 RepID=A0A5N6KRT3_9ROSI|nr:hypothetical protein FH972_022161 [Carpinus fangiana]